MDPLGQDGLAFDHSVLSKKFVLTGSDSYIAGLIASPARKVVVERCGLDHGNGAETTAGGSAQASVFLSGLQALVIVVIYICCGLELI